MEEHRLPAIEARKLQEMLQADFEQPVRDVADAVNASHPGSVIGDSEEPVRQVTAGLRQWVFEKAAQMKMDAAEAAFSPSEQPCDARSLPS